MKSKITNKKGGSLWYFEYFPTSVVIQEIEAAASQAGYIPVLKLDKDRL